MQFRINIIDDEKNLNDLVRTYLEKEGYIVYSFYTYDEALMHKDDDVHLWLIDIMLDRASGFELFNEIKASRPKMPIIFMSARDQEFDRIIGLEKGSDDYITKPCFYPDNRISCDNGRGLWRYHSDCIIYPQTVADGGARCHANASTGRGAA